MYLLQADIKLRVIIGISAMVLLFVFFLIAFISNQRRKLKYHKSLHALHEVQQKLLSEQNAQLEQKVKERTRELSDQKEELQQSLNELKSTQLQLVQKAKMASLGEMTAGIAHEIQNPLNFVNNFSEVGIEILTEAKEEIDAGNIKVAVDALEVAKANWLKVMSHGKRADAIVKSMLEHSRADRGEKQPTDLNALIDEYLKLAYHSFRAKDKSFSALLETAYDPSVGHINILAQDIGRMLINLFNNAFYAVHKRRQRGDLNFQPLVRVTTLRKEGKVEISVKDNGIGVPEKVQHKIFQPFFTTKPTGEGTGLGLSLSYDIVTKSHGGELKVDSNNGEGAQFTIVLPG